MILDAATAKALTAVIMLSTQGADMLNPQLPLQVVDRGESWLVTGTPFTDKRQGLQFIMCHAFINKGSAEVLGLGCDGRMILTDEQKIYWSKFMTKAQYDATFGPAVRFEPEGIRDIVLAAYGGVINKPADAVAYAHLLMLTKPSLASIPASDLQASEVKKVWHVNARMPGHADPVEVLSFSRRNGKLLSGDL